MHSIYLIMICLYVDGLGQKIDQTESPPIHGNTSASNQEMHGPLIASPTVNPPSQTTELPISGIDVQSTKAEGIMDSTGSTTSAQQVSNLQVLTQLVTASPMQHYSSNLTTKRNYISSPSGTVSTRRYPNNPTESRNHISDRSGNDSEAVTPTRTVDPQEIGRVPPPIHIRTRSPSLPVVTPTSSSHNTIVIPQKPKTNPASAKPTHKHTQPAITKPESPTAAKKTTPLQINTTPVVSTSTTPCPNLEHVGTFLELVFENNSQELCRKQIEEIKEGIGKYANELNGLQSDSVLVLNGCDICQANDTHTFKFCIQSGKGCNVDATNSVWKSIDERKELDTLENYVSVKIVSSNMTPPTKQQEPMNVIPLSVGLLSVAFLVLISGIFIFRGKTKKSPMKDRFYFDGSTIQDCLESPTNGNESYSLDKVKERELKHMSLLVPAINLGFDEEHNIENEFPSHLLSVNALKMYYTYKEAIDEEFKSLPYFRPLLKDLPVGVGNKNRSANVLPPLDTRVVLSSRVDSNGYINANQIKGYQSSKVAYIATQAPLSNTCADFWHMVWEQQSRMVVMLCTPDEIGKNVQQYWPKNHGMEGALLFGDILVSLESMTSSEHHTVSNLVVKDIEKNLCRPVSHYWFSWPADGVPSSPSDITGLLLHIRESITENQGPMVVHCSDGVGRTGTLLTIDISMRELEDTTHVDIPRTTCMVRKDRGAGVENALQYNYIYQALYDYSQRLSRANQQVGW